MSSLLNHIASIFQVNRRRRVYDQLQWQRFLLRTGIPATAHVLDMVQVKSEILEYVQVHIWVMVRLKGSISYRHIQTLLDKKEIPAVGQTIHIRFCPDDMSKVIII